MLARCPDGTPAVGNCGRRRGQGPEELQVGAVVERLELVQAELADPLGLQRTGIRRRDLDPVDDRLDVDGGDRPLVGGGEQGAAELRAIEALALAASLAHVRRFRLAPLERGEAPPAGGASPAAADRVAIGRPTALQDASGSAAGRTNHLLDSTRASVFLPVS